MTEAEIWSNIRYNENQIDRYSDQIRNLQNQIDELEALKNKCAGLQSRFAERQQVRQRKLASFLSSSLQNQIVRKYYSGMSGLLDGREFHDTYEGLSEARNVISRRIRQLDDQLDDARSNLAYRKRRREYWIQQLYNLPD